MSAEYPPQDDDSVPTITFGEKRKDAEKEKKAVDLKPSEFSVAGSFGGTGEEAGKEKSTPEKPLAGDRSNKPVGNPGYATAVEGYVGGRFIGTAFEDSSLMSGDAPKTAAKKDSKGDGAKKDIEKPAGKKPLTGAYSFKIDKITGGDDGEMRGGMRSSSVQSFSPEKVQDLSKGEALASIWEKLDKANPIKGEKAPEELGKGNAISSENFTKEQAFDVPSADERSARMLELVKEVQRCDSFGGLYDAVRKAKVVYDAEGYSMSAENIINELKVIEIFFSKNKQKPIIDSPMFVRITRAGYIRQKAFELASELVEPKKAASDPITFFDATTQPWSAWTSKEKRGTAANGNSDDAISRTFKRVWGWVKKPFLKKESAKAAAESSNQEKIDSPADIYAVAREGHMAITGMKNEPIEPAPSAEIKLEHLNPIAKEAYNKLSGSDDGSEGPKLESDKEKKPGIIKKAWEWLRRKKEKKENNPESKKSPETAEVASQQNEAESDSDPDGVSDEPLLESKIESEADNIPLERIERDLEMEEIFRAGLDAKILELKQMIERRRSSGRFGRIRDFLLGRHRQEKELVQEIRELKKIDRETSEAISALSRRMTQNLDDSLADLPDTILAGKDDTDSVSPEENGSDSKTEEGLRREFVDGEYELDSVFESNSGLWEAMRDGTVAIKMPESKDQRAAVLLDMKREMIVLLQKDHNAQKELDALISLGRKRKEVAADRSYVNKLISRAAYHEMISFQRWLMGEMLKGGEVSGESAYAEILPRILKFLEYYDGDNPELPYINAFRKVARFIKDSEARFAAK